MTGLHLVCAACGWTPGSLETDPYPFRCPRSGTDDGDHVITVRRESLPGAGELVGGGERFPTPADNPFIRYRTSLYSWHVARARLNQAGLKPCSAITEESHTNAKLDSNADREYCSLVERIDSAVEQIAGTGFHVTPFVRADRLSQALGFDAAGGVWVKDETRNVSGSHKARHMMGVALYLEVLRRFGIDDGSRPLAVASCGNAALAAAVVARAINRRLLVFVPEHADEAVVAELERLGATLTRCSRAGSGVGSEDPGLPGRGDPCYLAFRRAVAEGALPFSCQGNENGLVIEGGATIGYEIVEQMAAWPPARLKPCPTDINPGSLLPDPDWQGANEAGPNTHLASLDRVFVQVGGGALASACIRALTESVRSGSLAAMPRRSTPTRLPRWGPRICAVQTGGGYPLKRAYDRFVEHVLERLESASHSSRRAFASDAERAAWLLETVPDGLLEDSLRYARAHRSVFMWPWETEPRSIAAGILDDETYDWAAVVEGMVRSSGFPIVVDEATLREANARAREATGIDVDHTGSSGLAGLFALTRTDGRPRPDERVVVLFTGVRREGADV